MVLFAGIAALLLLAVPLDEARAQSDPRAPYVTDFEVTSLPKSGDTYKRGDKIRCTATFSEEVVVTGVPQVELRMIQQRRQADYHPTASGADRLVFEYTVQVSDYDNNGIYISRNSLTLNGGTILEWWDNQSRG